MAKEKGGENKVMSIYNSEGKPVKRKGHKGVIIGFFIVLILAIALGAWLWSEAVNSERLGNAGCEAEAFNQWGMVTMWSCPPGVELYQ